jgi:integrase
MKYSDHLWKRGGQWYFRMVVPRPLHPRIVSDNGKQHIHMITKVLGDSESQARRKRDRLVVVCRELFDRAEAGETITAAQIKSAMALDPELVAQQYKAMTRWNVPLGPEAPLEQIPLLDRAAVDATVEATAKSLGLPLNPASYNMILKALVDRIRQERQAQLASETAAKATLPVIEPVPVVLPTVPTETLREALDAWLANPRLGGGKPQQPLTMKGHRTHVECFIKAVGNVSLSSIERSVAADYIANLKGRTRTRNSHRMSLWMMYRNAGLRGRFSRNSSDNPFDGLHQSLTKEERKKHLSPFRVPELQDYFDSFRFEIAPKKRSPHTALPWASLVSLYSGMRREEIAQLVVSDIKECTANGATITAMRAHDEGSNSIKTGVTRLVPVHSALVRAGFLDYVAALPKNGPVFPGLQPRASKDGRLSCRIGELCTKRLKALGLKQKAAEETPPRSICFHSFKHTVGKTLDTAKESPQDIARVLGHAVEGISLETYSHEGPGLARVKAVIEAIQFEGLRLPTAV